MATSQSQRQIAVFGDTGKDLSDRVAAAEHAGLHPQYVAVSAPQKRYLYSVYAQVLRTQQAIIVRAYGLIYVFPQKTTTVSLSGTPVNTADLPSVDMPFVDAAIRAGKQPGQFAFGNVMKKRQICADCVVLASDHPSPQLTAQKLAALWNGKLDPWQTSTAYLPWAPPGKKSVGPDFSNPPHGGGSNPPPEYCGSCGSGGYTGDGPPGGGGGGHPTPPPRYTNWSSSKCSSVQNAMKAAGQSMYLPSTRSGNEYGAIAATDPSGGIHYSGNLTNNSPDQIDFAPVLNFMPTGWHAVGYIHVHPGPYQTDQEEMDPTTGNHFSPADEGLAYDQQIQGYVIVGGTTDEFEWNPPATNSKGFNQKQPDSSQGSVNSGKPGC